MLTVDEVAERYRVSRETVVSWIKGGQLAAIDVAPCGSKRRQYRIAPDSLAALEAVRSVRKLHKQQAFSHNTGSYRPQIMS